MPWVEYTIFKCKHCDTTIPNGLDRDDFGVVTCPQCHNGVIIKSNEYEDSRVQSIMTICWSSAAIFLFIAGFFYGYSDVYSGEIGNSIGMGVVFSIVFTYMVGGLIGAGIIKGFPREFRDE